MKLKKIIIVGLAQFAYWTIFFLLFKIFFLLFNHATYAAMPLTERLLIIFHGFRMDMSAAGYLTILPAVCLAFSPWFPTAALKSIRAYTYAMLPILVLMGCTDAATFTDWQTRLSVSILNFLSDPQGIAQSLSTAQWFAAAVVYAIFLALAVWAYKTMSFRLNKQESNTTGTEPVADGNTCEPKQCGNSIAYPKFASTDNPKSLHLIKITTAVAWLALSALLLLPIRGSVGNAPINPSSVSFSQHIASNYATYNFFWNFIYTALNRQPSVNPVTYMPAQQADQLFEQYFVESSPDTIVIQGIRTPCNVVMLILESFSAHLVGELTQGQNDYCPNLSQLCRNSIAFDSCYASGNRSDKGISALLLAYPSLINYSSILAEPQKLSTVTSLQSLMASNGYTTHFAYGGDIDFYNTKLMLLQSGVQRITERSDFPLSVNRMQKWGAPDQYLYERYSQELDTLPRPFFSACYNISSHPPFDVPGQNSAAEQKQKIINAMAYADSCLGVMLRQMQCKSLWDSTLVVIVSDHTASLHEFGIHIDNPENYRIPMLLTGGVVDTAYICHNICSQADVMATLSSICGIQLPSGTKFTKNMFNRGRQYAFFFRDELWGYVSPGYTFVQNIENGQRNFWYANCNPNDSIDSIARAYAQHVIDDYLSR